MTVNQLKATRKQLGLSQFALAGLTGVSRYNIAIFETGHRQLKPEEKKSIDEALNAKAKELGIKTSKKKVSKKKA